MMNRITPKAHAIPETNVRKGYLPPSAFGSGPSQDQDRVTIAHSPKFGMFNYLNSTTDQPAPLTPDQQTAFDAARKGRVSILEDLYRRTKSFEFLMGKDTEKRTILHYAAIGNDTEIVDFWDRALHSRLSRLNYNWINSQDEDGQTPLHWAARNNNKSVAVKLMASGASNTITNFQLKKPHELAVSPELAKLIQNGGMKLIEPISIEPIRLQTVAPLTQNLVSQRSPSLNSNVSSHNQNVTLRKLTQGKHNPDNERQVRTLLEQGASPNEPDAYQERTALHWAAINGHNKYVEMILRYNPDLALTDKGGYTALALAENKLRELQTNSRLGLRGEKNRREDVVRRLRTAARNAGLLSNSPTIAPSSPISSTVRPPVQNNTQDELDRRSLERHRQVNPQLQNDNNWLQTRIQNLETSKERHRTKKRQFKQDWKTEQQRADRLENERQSRLDKFEQEKQGKLPVSKSSPNKRHSSKSISRVLDSISPTRFVRLVQEAADKRKIALGRTLSPASQKILDLLKGGILNLNTINTKQLTVGNLEGISLSSAESRDVPVTEEIIQSVKDSLIALQDESNWQNRVGEIEENRSNLVKSLGKLGLTIGVGGVLTALNGGQSAPAVGKEVLNQLNSLINNPALLSPPVKGKVDDTKDGLGKLGDKIKQKYVPGDPFKKAEQLAQRLYKLTDVFSNSIKRARTLEECTDALIDFQASVMGESMNHLEQNGSPDQREDIKALRKFVNGYAELLRQLNRAPKTESHLEQFQQQMMKLVDELKERPRMEKLINELVGKQLNNLVKMQDMLNVRTLFGPYPENINLKQKSGHTCYMLSILDSIFHSGQANRILSKIKVYPSGDNNGYTVIFPAQPNNPIQVPYSQVNASTTVDCGQIGPKILEQAYLNFLGELKPEERERYQDPSYALIHIFGNYPQIKIQSVKLVKQGKSWVVVPINKEERATPIKARYDAHQGRFQIRDNQNELIQNVGENDMITPDQGRMRRLLAEQKRTGTELAATCELEGPLPDCYDEQTGKRLTRYKFYEPDHFIGGNKFNDSEKEEKLKEYIQNFRDLKKEKKPLPLDIWTVTKTGSEHYCSIRMNESTPNTICLFDPMEKPGKFIDDRIKKIKINEFFNRYNVVGMCLPGS